MNKKKLDKKDISIRLATLDDMKMVYDLANNKLVRESSYSSDEIKYENHVNWFQNKMKDTNFVLFIAENDGKFAGQIKFDIENNSALIGVSITPNYRGRGLGHILITLGVENITQKKPQVQTIDAYIKNENIASIKIFEKSGFIFSANLLYQKIPSKKYIININ